MEGGARQLNFVVLARFFCERFRVVDVWQINPRQGRTEAWTLMGAPRTLGVEVGSVNNGGGEEIKTFRFRLSSEQADSEAQKVVCQLVPSPLCRFLGPPKGDLQHICLFNVITRGVWCNLPIEMAARFPFYPIGDGGQREALDKLMGEAGAVAGAYMRFASTAKDGADVETIPVREEIDHGFLNRFAAATLALVTDRNLRNGIMPIPYDVCVAAGLPVFRGPPPPPSQFEGDAQTWNEHWLRVTEGQHRIQCFYALPVNHVLAWALRDEEYAARKRLPSLRFQFVPPAHAGMGADPVLLYYLVADLHMQQMEEEFRRVWMGKVDMRPLSALSWELIPNCNGAHYPAIPKDTEAIVGVAMLRSYLTYLAPEPGLTEDAIAELIPTLCPGFPEPSAWIPYDREEMTAIHMATANAQRQQEGGLPKRK